MNCPSPAPRPPQALTTPRVSAEAGAVSPNARRTVLLRAFRSWTMGGRLSPGGGQIAPSWTDDDRLSPREVAHRDGAGLDRGEGARARVGRGPRGAALDARGVLADDVELAAGLGLQVADRAPSRAAGAVGLRAGGEVAALQTQVGAQLPAAGLLAEE